MLAHCLILPHHQDNRTAHSDGGIEMQAKMSGVFGSNAFQVGQRIVIGTGRHKHVWEVLVADGRRIILKHYLHGSKS